MGNGGAGPSSPLHTRMLEGRTVSLYIYVCECKMMDVKSTWIPTLHRTDHVPWSLGIFPATTSWSRPNTKPLGDHGTPNAHNHWYDLLYHGVRAGVNRKSLKIAFGRRSDHIWLHNTRSCWNDGLRTLTSIWALTNKFPVTAEVALINYL